jgi:ribosomal protein S18 acetylase RimI-like enzyme
MTTDDLPAVGRLAGRLVRMHHDFDSKRFLSLPNAEAGYARYFASEIGSDQVVLLVAELTSAASRDEGIVGYAYARLEPRSYNELLDACAKLHDVYVDDRARRLGVGEALAREAIRVVTAKGAPRVVLLSAVRNEAAIRLFMRLGFRTTMLEMTREADAV